MNAVPEPSLGAPWSLGEDAFAAILREVGPGPVTRVLEFGSGASSVRLALNWPHAEVLSIDHDPKYAAATRELATQYDTTNLRVEVRPLGWKLRAGGLYQSYQDGPLPESLDVVLVDGPPQQTRRGREACLHMVATRLVVGGVVFLDDCQRPEERAAVRNWQRSYPGVFSFHEIDAGHGIVVARKQAATRGPRPAARVTADTFLIQARRLAAAAKLTVEDIASGRR